MFSSTGGHWELLMGLGVLVLGLAIAYGVWRNMTRNKANDAVTEKATHELYADPDHYDGAKREDLKRQVRPN